MIKTLTRLVAAACCASAALLAHAQPAYPSKPVTLVCPFAPGGFGDRACRVIALGLSDRWNSPVIVDNRPGAAGNIAAAYAIRRPADGYTLFLANTATDAINSSIYQKMEFDPAKDFEPVILVAKSANGLSSPACPPAPAHTAISPSTPASAALRAWRMLMTSWKTSPP